MQKWQSIDLEAYRQVGDPDVDRLVAEVLSDQQGESSGRLAYNALLLLADKLIEAPELSIIEDSRLSRQLKSMPKPLADYYDPMEAPDWVDSAKLALGAKLWQDNTLITLITLYAASLPACYLMKNGIPALYQTEKLREKKYIFQRIYETGLMLAATMDPGGIKIVEDAEFEDDRLLLEVLQKLDSDGQWQREGHGCCRMAGNPAIPLDTALIRSEIEKLRGKPKRYLWGKGYIAAKKVRFLHASMRFMLTQPENCRPWGNKENPQSLAETMSQRKSPWDTERYGVPVNQEDLAYTLLTFGLVIPRGLEAWGLPLSLEQKEAFLHLWRLIGYIMGVDQALLTDNWDEAQALFEMIQQRQAGPSDEGVVLTEALMGFLGDYMPHLPGLAHRLSAAMIINQLGMEHASFILDEMLIKDTRKFWRWPIYKVAAKSFRGYLIMREKVFKRFKHLGGLTANRIHEASELLIDSWRDGYSRKPFFVPADASTWVRAPGIDEDFLSLLRQWRRKLFANIGIGLLFLIIAVFGLTASVPISFISGWAAFKATLIVALSSWGISLAWMQFRLPVVFKMRPDNEDFFSAYR